MMHISAQDASSHVFSVMDGCQLGKVHSVFNNSFNLIFGERLVHIGASENGLSPFGLAITGQAAPMLTAAVRNAKTAQWLPESGEIVIGDSAIVATADVELHDMALEEDEEPNRQRLVLRAESCVEHLNKNGFRGGLIETEQEQKSLLDYLLHDRPAQTDFESRAAELVLLGKGEHMRLPEEIYDYWIGRGPGLTPSGDDMMTGLLASLEVQGILSLDLRASLKEYLERQGLKRTTPVACEYLLYALRGFFHASIQRLCMAFSSGDANQFQEALIEMEKIGHTSGIDTIIGMLIGIRAGRSLD